jgi:hypothetical protein
LFARLGLSGFLVALPDEHLLSCARDLSISGDLCVFSSQGTANLSF